MNLLLRPHQPPEDDLDGLLRAYFRAEMPHPWPALKTLPPRPVRAPRPASGKGLWRSRLALAAAIALFVLGSLLLGSRITSEGKPARDLPNPPTADKKGDPWDPRLPGARPQPEKVVPAEPELPFTETLEVGSKGTTYRLEVRPSK